VLIAVGVVLPFLIALISGSLVIPHNDDFNYRRVALDLYQYGRIQLTGWTVMSLIGQLFLVQPLLWLTGGAPWAFGTMTSFTAVVGIVASYLLVRPILPASRAFLVVLAVIVFPGFLLNTWNFMTDVPAYAAMVTCLVLGAPALLLPGSAGQRWLVASLVIGVFGFSIREFAIAAPAAVLLGAFATHGPRRPHLAAAVVTVATCAVVYYATSHLPGQGSPTLVPFEPSNVDRVLRAMATLAFGLSPALVIAASWWLARSHPLDAIIGAGAGVLLFSRGLLSSSQSGVPEMLVGNLFTRVGAPGSAAMAGERPDLFPPPLWDAINVVALLSAILMCCLVVAIVGGALRRGLLSHPFGTYRRLDPWTMLLLTFAVVYASGLTLFGLVASMFDRYLWPLVLPVGALLLARPAWADRPTGDFVRRRRPPVGTVLATLMLAALSGFSLLNLLNSVAFDAARWRMGEVAVGRGFPREVVDAGFEWVGQNATGVADVHARLTKGGMWYAALWPSHTTCAAVSSSLLDLPGFTLDFADNQAYRLFLVAGPETPLYLYRVANPGCS